MAGGGAERQLSQDTKRRGERETANGIARIFVRQRRTAQPPGGREERDGDGGREEQLRETRVRRGDVPGQQQQHGQTPEHALRDDGEQRDHAQNPQPAALFHAEQPDHRHDGEQTDHGGDHAVAVFIEDAAFHGWHDFAIGERPIRHGKTGIAAGNRAAGDNQQKCAESQDHRPAMQSGMEIRFSCHK